MLQEVGIWSVLLPLLIVVGIFALLGLIYKLLMNFKQAREEKDRSGNRLRYRGRLPK